MTNLSEWSTFYEVLGSASAALTGLQFVTIALLADIPIEDPSEAEASDAFATPTVVHFISALFLAAIGAAPWHRIALAAVLWAIAGVSGFLYTLVVIRRMRSQRVYQPVWEDWAFHVLLPLIAYATLAAAAVFARDQEAGALFAVAGSALLLLFIGVHNAWDNVTFLSHRKRMQGSPLK